MIVRTAQLYCKRPWLLALLIVLLAAACRGGGGNLPWQESFDEVGSWSTGEDAYSRGNVSDGAYLFEVLQNDISRWAAAGQNFGDGIYELEATQVSGPLDNGYGLLFRADAAAGNFYLFKVSGDGYVWIGRYRDGAEDATLIGDHWFDSAAVQKGLNVVNRLTVRAEAGNLIFYVNGQEVGRVTDNSFASGDVGVLVQTLGGAPVVVRFDAISVRALD